MDPRTYTKHSRISALELELVQLHVHVFEFNNNSFTLNEVVDIHTYVEQMN